MATRQLLLVVLAVGFMVTALAGGAYPAAEEWPTTIAETAGQAVVTVMATTEDDEARSQGSGFLISPDGLVVTNYHVIKDMTEAFLKLDNGSYLPVTGVVRKSLALTGQDLVVLKCEGRSLPALRLAGPDAVKVGQPVAAMGSPLGLEATLSTGVVSAMRELRKGVEVLQTTAPISPGSSGGPLLAKDGTVVGVTSAFLSEGQNLNFALVIRPIRELLAGLDNAAKQDVVALGSVSEALAGQGGTEPAGSRAAWEAPTSGFDVLMRMAALSDASISSADASAPGLANLDSIDVVATDVDRQAEALGITTSFLDSYTELALRKSGIVEVSEEATPTLYVNFACFELESDSVCYMLELQFVRPAVLTVPSKLTKDGKPVLAWAIVWEDDNCKVCKASSLRQKITDTIDGSLTDLLNEIRKANPKPAKENSGARK